MRQIKITASITNREAHLDKYLQEICNIPMISAEEEVRLALLIKEGDQQALDKLTKANLRFVVSVAKKYQGQGLSLSDLINEGNLGLMKAAGCFDGTRGFKFISFAVWWIRQSILHALAEHSRMIRLPLNKVGLKNRIHGAQCRLEQQLERSPSTGEVAEMLNMREDEIKDIMDHRDITVSLDSPFSPDDDGCLVDSLENMNADKADGQLNHGDSLKQEIDRSLQILTPRQKETICYFFGIGKEHSLSLEDIARKFDLTPERIRQIKDKAMIKLREAQSANLLRSFLGT